MLSCSGDCATLDRSGQVALRLGRESVVSDCETSVSAKTAGAALGVASSAMEAGSKGEMAKLGIEGLVTRPLRCEGVR